MATAAPFNWAEYLRLANELSSRAGDEAAMRSAISRAYYYVYHLALKRISDNDFIVNWEEGGSHLQVWNVFSRNPEAECQRLGDLGNQLREKRVRADYRDPYTRIEEDVPAILRDAQDFATRLSRLDRRHPNPRSVRR